MTKRQTFSLKVEPDPCPTLAVEEGSKGEGVGRWVPEKKHTLLAKLISGTHGARAKFPQRVLIDPFCGPGRIRVRGETITRDGGALVAWRQSVIDNVPFTSLLVGDLETDLSAACYARLTTLHAPAQKFDGTAEQTVKTMVSQVPRNALCLAYLDPYNLETLSFEIIRTLSELRHIDLLVHFSTMDLNRNVDLELDEKRARFDDAAPGWREPARSLSKGQLPGTFFDYWQSLVKQLGFTFSKEMPLVRDEGNKPLYRLVFFSRHDFPKRIWDDVARSPNRNLFEDD